MIIRHSLDMSKEYKEIFEDSVFLTRTNYVFSKTNQKRDKDTSKEKLNKTAQNSDKQASTNHSTKYPNFTKIDKTKTIENRWRTKEKLIGAELPSRIKRQLKNANKIAQSCLTTTTLTPSVDKNENRKNEKKNAFLKDNSVDNGLLNNRKNCVGDEKICENGEKNDTFILQEDNGVEGRNLRKRTVVTRNVITYEKFVKSPPKKVGNSHSKDSLVQTPNPEVNLSKFVF